MALFILTHFEKFDLDALDDYYSAEVPFEDREIQIDLNFNDTKIGSAQMQVAKNFIENIAGYDAKNKQYMLDDYNSANGEIVKEYLQHHLAEIDHDELAHLVDFSNKKISPEKQLLNQLQLGRLGLYPHEEDLFAVFDYTIGADLTNYLVVVNISKDGKLIDMSMES